ncbi:TetR/AcrR family transcriptional regulator [Clostridium thailandense]|uniref:TetR/AcrR family transcriptional regulator n=1 Tax=Clostridium thailandense TaxID=2794346 RepID=UPI0039898C8E
MTHLSYRKTYAMMSSRGDDIVPKDTFKNLNADKKQRIFDAAIQEFSTCSFSDASINQIIKTAGIPRGSFYQYFNDKEDLYLYMIEEISNEKKKLIPERVLNPDDDFFETFIQKTKDSLELGKVKPEYTKIGMLMQMDNSEFIAKFRTTSIEKYRKQLKHNKECGLIRQEVNTDIVLDMLFSYTLEEYFKSGFDENEYLKKVSDAINIIKEGIKLNKD